jgi:hypothetical protein
MRSTVDPSSVRVPERGSCPRTIPDGWFENFDDVTTTKPAFSRRCSAAADRSPLTFGTRTIFSFGVGEEVVDGAVGVTSADATVCDGVVESEVDARMTATTTTPSAIRIAALRLAFEGQPSGRFPPGT